MPRERAPYMNVFGQGKEVVKQRWQKLVGYVKAFKQVRRIWMVKVFSYHVLRICTWSVTLPRDIGVIIVTFIACALRLL